MAVVSMVIEGKYDMNGVMTTRCSLMIDVRRSVSYRARLVMTNFNGEALVWSNFVQDWS